MPKPAVSRCNFAVRSPRETSGRVTSAPAFALQVYGRGSAAITVATRRSRSSSVTTRRILTTSLLGWSRKNLPTIRRCASTTRCARRRATGISQHPTRIILTGMKQRGKRPAASAAELMQYGVCCYSPIAETHAITKLCSIGTDHKTWRPDNLTSLRSHLILIFSTPSRYVLDAQPNFCPRSRSLPALSDRQNGCNPPRISICSSILTRRQDNGVNKGRGIQFNCLVACRLGHPKRLVNISVHWLLLQRSKTELQKFGWSGRSHLPRRPQDRS